MDLYLYLSLYSASDMAGPKSALNNRIRRMGLAIWTHGNMGISFTEQFEMLGEDANGANKN